MRTNPLTQTLGPRRPEALPPACPVCRDRGLIWIEEQKQRSFEGSAQDVRRVLERGLACLCTCRQGQLWLSFLYVCYGDKPGAVPTRGVPDGLIHDERGIEALPRAKRTQ